MAKAKKRSGKKAAAADAMANQELTAGEGKAQATKKKNTKAKKTGQVPQEEPSTQTAVPQKRPLEAAPTEKKAPEQEAVMTDAPQVEVEISLPSSSSSSSTSSSLDLKPSPLGGHGLFVNRELDKGSLVYKDLAILAVQDASSRSLAPFICSGCLRATAGPAKQLRALLAAFTASADGDNESDEEIDLLPLPPPDTKLLREYEARNGISSAVVPCNCEQFYCSEACRATAVAFHKRLCPAEEEDGERANDALQEFCAAALKRELPHYSFVALIFGRMVSALIDENRPVGWSNLPAPLCELPLASWVQASPDDQIRKARTKAIQGCLPLLSEIFVTPEVLMKMPAGNSDVLFNFQLLDGVVGMLDRCVVDVECDNHFDKDLQSLTEEVDTGSSQESGRQLPSAKRRKKTALSPGIVKLARVAANQDTVEKSSASDVPTTLTRMLPRIRGVALVRGVALCNHSCEPNVSMEWHERAELMVRASRRLEPGEEVLISYLGEDVGSVPFEERQARLAEGWAFRCRCSRCVREAPSGWNWDAPVGCASTPSSGALDPQMDLDSDPDEEEGEGGDEDDEDEEGSSDWDGDGAADPKKKTSKKKKKKTRGLAAAKQPALRSWARRRA